MNSPNTCAARMLPGDARAHVCRGWRRSWLEGAELEDLHVVGCFWICPERPNLIMRKAATEFRYHEALTRYSLILPHPTATSLQDCRACVHEPQTKARLVHHRGTVTRYLPVHSLTR